MSRIINRQFVNNIAVTKVLEFVYDDSAVSGALAAGISEQANDELIEPENDNTCDEQLIEEAYDFQAVIEETENMVKELLAQARSEALNILEQAKTEAYELIEIAKQESENIKTSAQNEGYEQGLKSAQEEIEADRQLTIEQCAETLAEAKRDKIKILDSAVADMARLAMMIAKKILATEIITNPNIIVNVIREAVGYLDKPNNIQIYLNQEDMDKITTQLLSEVLGDIGVRTSEIDLYADKRIIPGGCNVESDVGSIDAQLETRINNVEKTVWEVATDEYTENA